MLTNWTVTQTNRFKAAVSQRDCQLGLVVVHGRLHALPAGMVSPTAIPRSAGVCEPVSRSPRSRRYRRRSHSSWVKQTGARPPESGGEQLFRALKFLKRPTAMVRFPNETHELSRSGQPWHRIERLRAILGWMDKDIRGKDVAQFRDVGQPELK